ncbi:MAG: diguanylate cyclase [Limnothrix sp. RL_2_0]|nr:diguanylate cyclase [Limnothrix sp. RL_2_0]
MPLILFLLLIIVCLLFVLRKLRIINRDLKLKIAEDVQFLQQISRIDPVTQVMDQQQFSHLLSQEWQRARRSQKPLAVIVCDVDYLGLFNSTHGQLAGDEALFAIAQTLDSTVKRAGECVGRLGGDEFWILLPNINQNDAVDLAKLLQSKIHGLAIAHEASPISEIMTVSMGLSSILPTESLYLQDFQRAVELACAEAKTEGRDRWCVTD